MKYPMSKIQIKIIKLMRNLILGWEFSDVSVSANESGWIEVKGSGDCV